MEKARPHTAPEALEKCVASEFLARCLAKAGFDAELCGDVTDACEVAELNALDLASGDLSSEEVASRLFLVDTEAKCVRVYACVSHAAQGLSLCRWQQQLMPLTSDGAEPGTSSASALLLRIQRTNPCPNHTIVCVCD